MDIESLWDKARSQTEILRMRLQDLATFDTTAVPYIFLGESMVNPGDTVVRQGKVLIDRPAIMLPKWSPQFEGFEFDAGLRMSDEHVVTFLLMRGVNFPSLKYQHQLSSLEVMERSLREAVSHYEQRLQRAEDTKTGLVVGPEETWQLSLLLLVGALVIRSAEGDVRRLIEEWKRRQRDSGDAG